MTPPRLGDGLRERVPDALLDGGGGAPSLFRPTTGDRHLVRIEERCGLQHVERFLACLVVAPLEHVETCLRETLVDAVEDHVLGALGPALFRDVDAVHEGHADELGLAEVVATEGIRVPLWVDLVGVRAPRPAVEADVHDATGEPAVDELRRERLPRVDPRAVERAALEPRLPGTHAGEVGAVELAVAEHALAPAREERLVATVERLTAEVAVLEGAALRGELIERDVAEIRVTDRDPTQHEDALHRRALPGRR